MKSFRGDWAFLSNMHALRAGVELDGVVYPTVEHAFVASKTLSAAERAPIPAMDPVRAKRYGRTVTLRADWDDVKVTIMEDLVGQKFRRNAELARKLVAIEGVITEHNEWHDNFWGICTCGRCKGGSNHLGRIVMKIREELKEV